MLNRADPAGRLFSAGAPCRFFTAILILLWSYSTLYAQTEIKISGQVIDAITAGSIPGAVVTIEGTGRSVATDGAGRFQFTDLPPGDYLISVDRIGYSQQSPIETSLKDDLGVSVTLEMWPSPVTVENQTVLSQDNDELTVSRSGASTVVETGKSGLHSLAELAEIIPEVELVESGTGKFLRFRGAELKGTVIMLDGRMINSVFDSRADVSSIPLGSVTRVEIVAGSDYRNPGLAGSVNFITEMDGKRSGATVSAERGSFDREYYSAKLDRSRERKLSFSLDASSSFSRGDFEFVDPRDSAQSRINNHDGFKQLFGRMRYAWNGSLFRSNLRYSSRQAGIPGQVFQLTPEANSDVEERDIHAEYEKNIRANIDINLMAGLSGRRAELNSPRTPANFIPYKTRFVEQARDIRIAVNRTGPTDLDAYFSARYESLDGEDLIRPSSSFGLRRRTVNTLGAGAVFRFPIPYSNGKLSSLTMGAKSEWGYGGSFISPSSSLRFNLDYPLKPGLDISYSRGRRLPDLTDLYWKEDVFATPNPELSPERSESVHVGADMRGDMKGAVSFRISRYFTYYRDLIIWRKWAGDKFKPVNLSRASIDGWEFAAEINPLSGPATLRWTASFLKPLNKEDEQNHYDKYLTFRPVGSQTAILDFEYRGIRLKLRGRHIGRRYTTEENTKSLPAVQLVDMEIEFEITLGFLSATTGIGVNNLGDIRYEILDRQPERPREYRINIALTSAGGSE